MQLTDKLKAYLAEKNGGPVQITEFRQLSGGACQDNYLVGMEIPSHGGSTPFDSAPKRSPEDGSQGRSLTNHETYVLRTDKGGALLGSLSRAQEYQVIEKAVAAGVLTPPVKWLSEDTSIVGHPFYLMQKIDGTANPREILKNKKIDFQKLAADTALNLAKIHSVQYAPNTLPFLDRKLRNGTNDVALTAVADCRRLLDELPGGYPGIELCLNWAEANAPETDKLVLAHSDFRTGNFMVGGADASLTGILDWEFAHWSDRHEDIGYIRMRDWRFGKVKNAIGGFAAPEDFYPHYEAASGVKIDERKVRYWEVMGNIRWAIGAAQQGERHLSGKDKGIEFASIGRRVSEMELEAMRLIEGESLK